MTKKDDLQQELLEKVKPGTKPSHLKRSKSADDISPSPLTKGSDFVPKPPPLPIANPSELIQLKQENSQLKTGLHEVQSRLKDLSDFAKNSNPSPSFTNPTPSLSTLDELDHSLIARHQGLKDWWTQYSKNKDLDQELTENIDQASTELSNQGQTISQLRSENEKLKLTNQSLQKDLDLAQRAVKWRQTPFSSPNSTSFPFLKYALYSLAVAVFTLWLVNSLKHYD